MTVLREGPLGVGMVQRFVDHDPEEHYFTLLEENADRFRQFAVFDVLVNNADRKGGHCIRSRPSGAIVGIDHGLTFHPAWKLRTVIWDFAGEAVSPQLADDVCRVAVDVDGPLGVPCRLDARARRGGSANELIGAGDPTPTPVTTRSRGRSCEPLAGLAPWATEPPVTCPWFPVASVASASGRRL